LINSVRGCGIMEQVNNVGSESWPFRTSEE
jgi:hypothetical protein